MKLISLNTWGGKLYKPVIEFVKKAAKTTDIFCFQEVYFSKVLRPDIPWIRANLAFELKSILSGFSMFQGLAIKGSYTQNKPSRKDIRIGEAIFIKKPLRVVKNGGFHTYGEDSESRKEKIEVASGNFQFAKVKNVSEDYFIGNIHGLWLPGSKSDTPKRVEQSAHLKDFIKKFRCKKILCGDFNLQPKTKSIAMLDSGMRDLVKEYKVKTTRSRYYADMKKYADYIADYIFVSPDVRVKDFKVLTNEISDHFPLFLDFE